MEISEETIDSCRSIPILDSKGETRDFGSLIAGGRHLIIFIRHFFCGVCQHYVRTLSSSISPDELQTAKPPISITIIGCGQPDLIEMYKSETDCRFNLLAEPTRKIYDTLGMTRTLELGEKKPDYFQSGLFAAIAQSIYQGIRAGTGALKGGDIKQVGGELLFEDGKLVWSHRMKNTQDHTEVPEIRKVIRLDKESDRPVIDK